MRGATLAWAGIRRGGHATYVLQWLEGLQRLGHDVLYHDVVDDRPEVVRAFRDIVERSWRPQRSAAVLPSGEVVYGIDMAEIEQFARQAAAVISLGATYSADLEPWLEPARPRVLVDQDPGFTHIWASDTSAADVFGVHDLYYTVGANVGTDRSRIPLCGIDWRRTWNPVVVEWCATASAPTRPFTTVASLWSQSYQRFDGVIYGPKAAELDKFLDLPARSGESFELAVEAGTGEAQLAKLHDHGWTVRDAEDVAATPERYLDYVKSSTGEFSPVKGLYVGTRSGWFSDRSACYLAAGRPVVTQDTGLADVLPLGKGLHAVATVDEAAEAIRQIRRDYARESKAARNIAAEHFDARRLLRPLLDDIGVA